MFLGVLIAFMVGLLWVGAFAWGLTLVWLGACGRRINEHPCCSTCGYDLIGSPIDPHRCPECGVEFYSAGCIMRGVVERSDRLVATGAGIVIVAVSPLGLAFLPQTSPAPPAPVAVAAAPPGPVAMAPQRATPPPPPKAIARMTSTPSHGRSEEPGGESSDHFASRTAGARVRWSRGGWSPGQLFKDDGSGVGYGALWQAEQRLARQPIHVLDPVTTLLPSRPLGPSALELSRALLPGSTMPEALHQTMEIKPLGSRPGGGRLGRSIR